MITIITMIIYIIDIILLIISSIQSSNHQVVKLTTRPTTWWQERGISSPVKARPGWWESGGGHQFWKRSSEPKVRFASAGEQVRAAMTFFPFRKSLVGGAGGLARGARGGPQGRKSFWNSIFEYKADLVLFQTLPPYYSSGKKLYSVD